MAKKTVKVGLRSAGNEPAAGDVNISYKGSRIAGLSESSTAILETENTIVQDDIEIEYTKPETPTTKVTGLFEYPEIEGVGMGNTPHPADDQFTPGEPITLSVSNQNNRSITVNFTITSDEYLLRLSVTVEAESSASLIFWAPNNDFTVTGR